MLQLRGDLARSRADMLAHRARIFLLLTLGEFVGDQLPSTPSSRLAAAFKKDPPGAFIEDAIAIGGGWLSVQILS